MFDVGFFEIMLISVISLLVLGPERLPKAARTVGRWVGKAKSTVAAFKSDIDRELQLEEMKAKLEEHARQLQEAGNLVNKEAQALTDSARNLHHSESEQSEYKPYPADGSDEVNPDKEVTVDQHEDYHDDDDCEYDGDEDDYYDIKPHHDVTDEEDVEPIVVQQSKPKQTKDAPRADEQHINATNDQRTPEQNDQEQPSLKDQ